MSKLDEATHKKTIGVLTGLIGAVDVMMDVVEVMDADPDQEIIPNLARAKRRMDDRVRVLKEEQ